MNISAYEYKHLLKMIDDLKSKLKVKDAEISLINEVNLSIQKRLNYCKKCKAFIELKK